MSSHPSQPAKFAIINIGGVVLDQIDELALSLSFLYCVTVGLYLVVLHGTSPQLNEILKRGHALMNESWVISTVTDTDVWVWRKGWPGVWHANEDAQAWHEGRVGVWPANEGGWAWREGQVGAWPANEGGRA